MEYRIDTDIETLVAKLPPHIAEPLTRRQEDNVDLLEVVLDLGRQPEARYVSNTVMLNPREVSEEDVQYVIQRIGEFGGDNRAGIERTLHRISAIRNRNEKVVGLTLRVGRAVYGTIKIIEDLILTGKSVLLLGRPGVGKTTMLREVARVLADDAHKRVIVVDTSNEIAGDGDIPHPGIGTARRMQVPSPALQHAVMIEAVENHMPEVIVIDEIGTELDANAARTIAERGVQLVATAHGNTLENLIMNPTLSDLIGGVQSVILGDDEARRRRSQKTVLERRAPPTFDILVEIQGWSNVAVHADVAEVVDRMLRRYPATPEIRTIDHDGKVERSQSSQPEAIPRAQRGHDRTVRLHPRPSTAVPGGGASHGTGKSRMRGSRPAQPTFFLTASTRESSSRLCEAPGPPSSWSPTLATPTCLLTTKNYYRRKTKALREAEENGKPVYVLRKNTTPQIEQFMKAISRGHGGERAQPGLAEAVSEAEDAVERVAGGLPRVELSPQGAYVRHLQHQIAEQHGLPSSSVGAEPDRQVVVYRR